MRAARWAEYERKATALDVGRGLAILSVIYGHALAPWFMGAGEQFSQAGFLQWKFGASFMMTFFFFLSGIGWREDKSFASTMRQAGTLVLVAWLACVSFDVVRLVATIIGVAMPLGLAPLGFVDFAKDAARMALLGDAYSLSSLWFLTALAVVRVFAALISRFGAFAVICSAALLLVLTLTSTSFGWRNFYQVNLIGVAFIAFLAGHAARGLLRGLERSMSGAYALTLSMGILTVLTFDMNQGCRWDVLARCGQDWLGGGFGVSMVIGQFGNIPMFAITAVTGTLFVLGLSVLLARFGGIVGNKLDTWGRNSLNLLIVNALFLHVGNELVTRWILPHVKADNPLFFVALLTLTMAANLFLVHALARPLRRLQSLARRIATEIVDIGERVLSAGVALRAHRVSQVND